MGSSTGCWAIEPRRELCRRSAGRDLPHLFERPVPSELERIARTTPEEMEAIHRTYCVGFAQLGTTNWTVQSANGLAAVLLACGQDVACLTECANGWLDLETTDQGTCTEPSRCPPCSWGPWGAAPDLGLRRSAWN